MGRFPSQRCCGRQNGSELTEKSSVQGENLARCLQKTQHVFTAYAALSARYSSIRF